MTVEERQQFQAEVDGRIGFMRREMRRTNIAWRFATIFFVAFADTAIILAFKCYVEHCR